MIINDLDDYYIVFDTKNRNIELDTLMNKSRLVLVCGHIQRMGNPSCDAYLHNT